MGYVICAGERVQVACPGPPPHTGGSGCGEVYGPNGGPSPTGKRTEVAFEKEIEFERGFGLFSNWKREKTIGDKVALSFPKIISARSDDAIRTRLV
jgi:hypothetical protein